MRRWSGWQRRPCRFRSNINLFTCTLPCRPIEVIRANPLNSLAFDGAVQATLRRIRRGAVLGPKSIHRLAGTRCNCVPTGYGVVLLAENLYATQ